MIPTYKSECGRVTLHLGDCLDRLREMPDDSVDSVVTDPPYGLSFMGKKWDYDVPGEDVWRECLRVLKPGGHLLAFAGTRTQHRMAVRIEDAGFEIRDMIAWVYGSGFPKSLNVGKAIDKAAGAERDVVGYNDIARRNNPDNLAKRRDGLGAMCGKGAIRTREEAAAITAPATEAAKQWDGWGTALKPAMEMITVARKPLGEKTVAANVLEHGTGAINVDGCRISTGGEEFGNLPNRAWQTKDGLTYAESGHDHRNGSNTEAVEKLKNLGRWPANLIHSGCDEVVGLFPVTGASKSTPRNNGEFKSVAKGRDLPHVTHGHDYNGGSAARFFYCAKASKRDRDEGCEGLEAKVKAMGNQAAAEIKRGHDPTLTIDKKSGMSLVKMRNHHPTVKPTDLMRYLCRLVTPPGGVVLDPFMGSGSTGKAAMLEGFRFIGIEREAEYLEISKARITAVLSPGELFQGLTRSQSSG